jgi:hypothetical protein
MTGLCGLCQQEGKLQVSHLLPRAAYKPVRGRRAGVEGDPVAITPKSARITPEQVKTPFLCWPCEQRFCSRGEDPVLPSCAQQDGRFRLREQLQAVTPLHPEGLSMVYDAVPILGQAIDAYLYFAASVFWRSAACRWPTGKEWLPSISLGPTYQEQFRLYLLDRGPFPANARIVLSVATERDLDVLLTLSFPRTGRLTAVHCHDFFVNGLLFVLFLGKVVASRHDDKALNSTQPCIWLTPWTNTPFYRASRQMGRTSKPAGTFRQLISLHKSEDPNG